MSLVTLMGRVKLVSRWRHGRWSLIKIRWEVGHKPVGSGEVSRSIWLDVWMGFTVKKQAWNGRCYYTPTSKSKLFHVKWSWCAESQNIYLQFVLYFLIISYLVNFLIYLFIIVFNFTLIFLRRSHHCFDCIICIVLFIFF